MWLSFHLGTLHMNSFPHLFMSVIPLHSEPGPHSSPSGVCSFLWSEESYSVEDRTQSSCLLSMFSESLGLLSGSLSLSVCTEARGQLPGLFYETGSFTETQGLPIRLDWLVRDPWCPPVSASPALRLQMCITMTQNLRIKHRSSQWEIYQLPLNLSDEVPHR